MCINISTVFNVLFKTKIICLSDYNFKYITVLNYGAYIYRYNLTLLKII